MRSCKEGQKVHKLKAGGNGSTRRLTGPSKVDSIWFAEMRLYPGSFAEGLACARAYKIGCDCARQIIANAGHSRWGVLSFFVRLLERLAYPVFLFVQFLLLEEQVEIELGDLELTEVAI